MDRNRIVLKTGKVAKEKIKQKVIFVLSPKITNECLKFIKMKTKWCQNTKVVPFLIMTRPTQKFHFLQTECTIIVPWKTCINRRQQILKLNFILSKKAVSCAALLSAMLLRAFCPLIWFRLSNVLDSPLNFEGRYIAHLTEIKLRT